MLALYSWFNRIKVLFLEFLYPSVPPGYYIDKNSNAWPTGKTQVAKGAYITPDLYVNNNTPYIGGNLLRCPNSVMSNANDEKRSLLVSEEDCLDVIYTTSAGKCVRVLDKEIIAKIENGQAVVINACENDEDQGVI